MTRYQEICRDLQTHPKVWLVTGVAGFIGSNLLQRLLELDQRVVGLDNFSSGKPGNLDDVRSLVSTNAWDRFSFHEGDIRNLATCRLACEGVDVVLHQAALGSVPRSILDPITSHESNVNGFLNMLVAARDAKIQRFVYASSSSVYGDDPGLPKVETRTGNALSPYALNKVIDESYASVFARNYSFKAIGLRYFNVFGPRQDPEGPYAAVMPKWIAGLLKGEPCSIHGDGETSRDFCFVANAIQANLLAGNAPAAILGEVFNVSFGGSTTLNQLYQLILERLGSARPDLAGKLPIYASTRAGDIRHSQADLSKVMKLMGYKPTHSVAEGLDEYIPWFLADAAKNGVHKK